MFVQNTEARILGFYGKEYRLRLIPGVNEVSDDLWKNCQVNKLLQKMLAAGMVVALDTKGGDAKPAASLAEMTAADAVKLVSGTLDEVLLKKWAGKEERKTVQDAIAAQFKKLEEAGKPNKD